MSNYIAIVNSIAIGSGVLQNRFGYSSTEAGFLYTLPYIISAVLSPLFGAFVNKFGHRMTFILGGSALMFLAHFISFVIKDCDKCF